MKKIQIYYDKHLNNLKKYSHRVENGTLSIKDFNIYLNMCLLEKI